MNIRGGSACVVFAVGLFVTGGCGGPSERVPLPPRGAGPDVVMDAYLTALRAGDCDTTAALGVPPFGFGNGALCGHLTVEAVTRDGAPAEPNPDERVYATTVSVSDGDPSMEDGEHLWFYSLRRQPDGSWRLAGGGTAP